MNMTHHQYVHTTYECVVPFYAAIGKRHTDETVNRQ